MSDNPRYWDRELVEFLHGGEYALPKGARFVVIIREEERTEHNDATLIRFRAYDFTDKEPVPFTNQIVIHDESVNRFPAMTQSYNLKTFVDLIMRLYDKSFARAKSSK